MEGDHLMTAHYRTTYHWDSSYALPTLVVTVEDDFNWQPLAISAIIDEMHRVVDQESPGRAFIMYDMRHASTQMPVRALMRREHWSKKVQGVLLVGAFRRPDEMAVLIAANAKCLPYPYLFFTEMEAAEQYLHQQAAATD